MKIALLVTLAFLLSFSALALSTEQREQLRSVISEVALRSHPEIRNPNLSIDLYPIENPDYFLESNFHILKRVIFKQKKYRIGVNPKIFQNDITRSALIGVMAHELTHTEDYEQGRLLKVAFVYAFGKKMKKRYERYTDIKVVFKGYARELNEYKTWQYKLLSPDALKKKKAQYLTPEEVTFLQQAIEDLNEEKRGQLLKELKKKTPLNLKEMKNRVHSFLK